MQILLIKTFPLSLSEWEKVGIIDRELELFKSISSKTNYNYSIGTFGDNNDLKYSEKIKPIKILPFFKKITFINSLFLKYIYSFFLPIIFKKNFEHFNIIQSNQFWGSWVLILSKLILRKKIILRQGFNFYDFLIKNKSNKIIILLIRIYSKFIYNYTDFIVVTTYRSRNSISKIFKINKNKIKVIPNFIDVNKFYPINSMKKINKILCVGRLTQQKNYELLFKSLIGSNYEVDIIGHGDPKLYNQIINSNNLKVNFLGNISNQDLPKVYNSYKVYILCSLYEGHPKSLLEAMSCGVNCIGTNVEGIADLYENNNFHLVELNPKSLREKINFLMQKDSSINLEASKYIKNNFSIQVIKKKYIRLYNQFN